VSECCLASLLLRETSCLLRDAAGEVIDALLLLLQLLLLTCACGMRGRIIEMRSTVGRGVM
jgi:hypothetical protein